jgi:hypothetical protein
MINLKVKKLFSLPAERFNEYYNVLHHLYPKPLKKYQKVQSLTELTFGEVATIKMDIQKPSIENLLSIYKVIFGIEDKDFYSLDAVSFFHSLNWINEQIKGIIDREQKSLASEPDSKLKEAGIEQMSVFGEMNTLIAIGEKFGKTPQEVENWNYNLVFTLMLHQKKSYEINKKYQEIITPKKP